jgi:ADP-heptose:LPS heptosyltransferase
MLKRDNFVRSFNWILANIIDIVGFCIFDIFQKINSHKNKQNVRVNNILIIRTDMLGDILVTFPFISLLKNLFRGTKIDILIRPKYVDVVRSNPEINEVSLSSSVLGDIVFAFKAKHQHYDIVVSPRNDGYLFNHFVSFLIKGKRRVGFGMKGGGFLLTDIIPWESEKSILVLLQDIALTLKKDIKVEEISKKNKLSVSFKEESYIERILGEHGISRDDLIVGLNLFASHKYIWPINRFLFVAKHLFDNFGAKIVFIGEKPLTQDIINKIDFPHIDLSGKTNVMQVFALISKFKLFITVDSGPRHIANAVSTPVIVLRNGANSSTVWGRYTENEYLLLKNVFCSPCGKKFCPEGKRICMNTITVEEVLNIATNRIKYQNWEIN